MGATAPLLDWESIEFEELDRNRRLHHIYPVNWSYLPPTQKENPERTRRSGLQLRGSV